MKRTLSAVILIFWVLLFSCKPISNTMNRVDIQGEAQGTYYAVSYFSSEESVSKIQLDSILDQFNFSVSLWEEHSLLSRLNRGENVELDSILIDNFMLSREVWEATDGYFDITIGPLANAWGFGFKTGKHPTAVQVDSLKQFVGMEKISLEGNILNKACPVECNFNAIAQGYSSDLIAGFLRKQGINSYIVDVGGEIAVGDKKPDGELWFVGVERPVDLGDSLSSRNIQEVTSVQNCAVATSGSYRKFYMEDGKRFSHTINPKTGYPVSYSLLSATVICQDCALADAYATAFMVMGVDEAKTFVQLHPEFELYLIFEGSNQELEVWHTPNFPL